MGSRGFSTHIKANAQIYANRRQEDDDLVIQEFEARGTADQRTYNVNNLRELLRFEHGREMALFNAETYTAFAVGESSPKALT
jgi:hypothetical protein